MIYNMHRPLNDIHFPFLIFSCTNVFHSYARSKSYVTVSQYATDLLVFFQYILLSSCLSKVLGVEPNNVRTFSTKLEMRSCRYNAKQYVPVNCSKRSALHSSCGFLQKHLNMSRNHSYSSLAFNQKQMTIVIAF